MHVVGSSTTTLAIGVVDAPSVVLFESSHCEELTVLADLEGTPDWGLARAELQAGIMSEFEREAESIYLRSNFQAPIHVEDRYETASISLPCLAFILFPEPKFWVIRRLPWNSCCLLWLT
jgi:hypothetical protein